MNVTTSTLAAFIFSEYYILFSTGKELGYGIPLLPPKKTVVEVLADFLAYLLKCALSFICETHANGARLWASVKDQQYVGHRKICESPASSLAVTCETPVISRLRNGLSVSYHLLSHYLRFCFVLRALNKL